MNPPHPSVVTLAAGTRGVDCNQPIDEEGARALYEKGFRFAVRYVGRRENLPHDITRGEILELFDAGLALMLVQHVESADSWYPTHAKGREYGLHAGINAAELGVPSGATVWCDLEGVAEGTQPADVIAYAQQWFSAVQNAGYLPGLYVGWRCGLTPSQLYRSLSFARYWSAYNLNADQYPEKRGVCMKQHVAKPNELPAGFRPDGFDTNTVQADGFNALPAAYASLSWAP